MKNAPSLLTSLTLVGFALTVIVLIGVSYAIGRAGSGGEQMSASRPPLLEMNECLARRGAHAQSMDPLEVNRVSVLCYEHLRRSYVLQDFLTRRSVYVQQQVQGTVMLWMVVAITISGVFLAGLQLMAAYRLAVDGTGNLGEASEIGLERGRLSVRSSVTGLSILTISFAFFAVFVAWVYTLKQDNERPEKIAVPSAPIAAALPFKIIPGEGKLIDDPRPN